MKKSIVLFVTLLFVASLSILILKNLADTEAYVSKQNAKISKVQILSLIKNIQVEIEKLLKNSAVRTQLDKKLKKEQIIFPLKFEDIMAFVTFKKYGVYKEDKYFEGGFKKAKLNINDLISADDKVQLKAMDFLNSEGIYDLMPLIDLLENIKYNNTQNSNEEKSKSSSEQKDTTGAEKLNKNQKIANDKQLDDIIKDYIKEVSDNKILTIRDKIGFKSNADKIYELLVSITYLKESVNAYYILGKEGKVEYFELGFK